MVNDDEIKRITGELRDNHRPEALSIVSLLNAHMTHVPEDVRRITIGTLRVCIDAFCEDAGISVDELRAAHAALHRANITLGVLANLPE